MMITEQIPVEPASPGRSEDAADTDIFPTLTDLTQRVRAVIKERPVAAVLTAVGVGYVVARLVSRGER
jgi:hypothetical protein